MQRSARLLWEQVVGSSNLSCPTRSRARIAVSLLIPCRGLADARCEIRDPLGVRGEASESSWLAHGPANSLADTASQLHGPLAQLAERRICNAEVVGSRPARSTIAGG